MFYIMVTKDNFLRSFSLSILKRCFFSQAEDMDEHLSLPRLSPNPSPGTHKLYSSFADSIFSKKDLLQAEPLLEMTDDQIK
jgi:hypothetical protein